MKSLFIKKYVFLIRSLLSKEDFDNFDNKILNKYDFLKKIDKS
jgi:hypothetical protein